MPARALTAVLTGVTVVSALVSVSSAPALAAGGGGCHSTRADPYGYNVFCEFSDLFGGSRTAAKPSGGPAPPNPCTYYRIPRDPTHMLQVCQGGLNFSSTGYGRHSYGLTQTVVPVAPQVTPQDLLARAVAELVLPLPAVHTAPPRGTDGLVGLPEWFWVPRGQWHPMTARVAVAGVWAQVIAIPRSLEIQPGTGAAGTGVTCRGPGTAYNPDLPAAGQHSNCTYTYTDSSDGLPGNAYQASVTVTWTATWQGSGGAGGGLPALGRTAAFAVPVAEAQAINGT